MTHDNVDHSPEQSLPFQKAAANKHIFNNRRYALLGALGAKKDYSNQQGSLFCVTSVNKFGNTPQQNRDNLPILQYPDNPFRPGYLKELEGENMVIEPENWAALTDLFQGMSSKQKEEVKINLIESAYNFKKMQGSLANRIAYNLKELPSEEIVAARAIPQGTMVGPFAGVFHKNKACLREEIEKSGWKKSDEEYQEKYVWYLDNEDGSPSNRCISSSLYGNTITKIPAAEKDAHHNVEVMRFGNVPFYITASKIEKGELLLVNGGFGSTIKIQNDQREISRGNQPDAKAPIECGEVASSSLQEISSSVPPLNKRIQTDNAKMNVPKTTWRKRYLEETSLLEKTRLLQLRKDILLTIQSEIVRSKNNRVMRKNLIDKLKGKNNVNESEIDLQVIYITAALMVAGSLETKKENGETYYSLTSSEKL